MSREALTLKELQAYIKNKDHNPEKREAYILKLMEEIGELAEAIRKDKRMTDGQIKGTIEEELYDVLYYLLALANIYEVDLETSFHLKEALNKVKWGN
jgi:NTP pyrophosphatase (non-canonical NTP hydrolase)